MDRIFKDTSMLSHREFTHQASRPSIVGLALVAMPLSGVHAPGWASVSTPTLLRDRTFPVAGMETGDHLSAAN